MINRCRLFNAKAILVEQQGYYSTGLKRFNPFSKDMSPKVNLKERLEFELVYFKAAVQPLRLGTPSIIS